MGIREDHLPRLNTHVRPIVNQYREGKVKTYVYKQWKGYVVLRDVTPDRVPFA